MITPNEDRIFVRIIKNPDKTKGGLIIPEMAKQKPTSGIVTHVGPGANCRHCGLPHTPKLEVGWMVMFSEHAGMEIEIDGVEMKVIRYGDIQMIDKDYKADE